MNEGHPPTYNNNLKDGLPIPLNEDYLDLIFKDKDKDYLSTEVEVKSFKSVNSK